MELRVLKYFLMVAREENITKAAQLLHVTQPTLSRQLMQLEEELGVQLFHRGKHNVTLTEDGMLLRRRAQELVSLSEKTKMELQHKEEMPTGEIAIGCGDSPDNIMINKKFEVKVIDFGAAKEFHGEKDNAILLKHGYAPIEQYDRNGNQGPWTDVYSLSASIYYLLSHVKLQKAFERVADDQLQSLRALGIPISERQDMALLKGMSVQIKDRFQSMADLYYALYGECIPGEKVPLNWQAEMQQRQNEQMSNENVYMTGQISNDNVNTTNQSSNESIYTVNQMSNDNTNITNQASNGSAYTTNQAPNDNIYTTNQAVIERIQPTEPEYQNYPGRQKADGNEPVYQTASVSDRYIPDKSREEAAMEYLRQQLDNQ